MIFGPGTALPGYGLHRRVTHVQRLRVAGTPPGTPRDSRTRRGRVRRGGPPIRAASVPSTPGSGTRPRWTDRGQSWPLGCRGWPSRHPTVEVVEAQRGVVVAQRTLLDVGFSDRAQYPDPVTPQCPGCRDMGRIGNRLVPRPEARMIGNDPALAEHPHAPQVGDHLDTAADHRRVHRVVVAVQTDVMITSQPHRGPPTC